MKLTDLNPTWLGSGGAGITRDGKPAPERDGIGVMFDCPCGCDSPCFVEFRNPLDGQPPDAPLDHPSWQRTGDTFETLTLTPSIHCSRGCGWHGFITDGEIKTC